jgi:Predicted metal-dependent hydrolase
VAPSKSSDPTVRLNNLCDRLWLIAAIEHYTAVLGDFSLNCAWDDHGADPTMVDLFRWHGSEEVEHRNVAHDMAVYFHDSYDERSAQCVPAGDSRPRVPDKTTPLHRGRHRDNADHAHARRGAAPRRGMVDDLRGPQS